MNLESANLFAALDTKKKKKGKSTKDHDKKKKPDKAEKAAELDRAVFSQQVPTSTNWADEDDDDDFDNDLGPLPESWAQVIVVAVTDCDAVFCAVLIVLVPSRHRTLSRPRQPKKMQQTATRCLSEQTLVVCKLLYTCYRSLFDFLSIVQEVDQQAIEEALGIELGKEDEDEDEEQEGSLSIQCCI